jgi:DUF1009 family protein
MNRLGLIAGDGDLPHLLLRHCNRKGIQVFAILLQPFAQSCDFAGVEFEEMEIGHVGKAIKFLQKNKVEDIIFAGGIRKPSLNFLRMDLKGLELVKNLLRQRIRGDGQLTQVIIDFFTHQGFKVLAVDEVLRDLKLHKGVNGRIRCGRDYLKDIQLGVEYLQQANVFDIGQAVVVQQKTLLGVECVEGTTELINRLEKFKFASGRLPVLVKIKKPQQPREMDLPTIGPDTLQQSHRSGFAGIAVDHRNCLVVNREIMLEEADRLGLFVYGLEI